MSRALRTLLTDLIDYAGLYPPAKLEMDKAVEAYAHARRGEHEWMLGRFVCPASRLEEFSEHAAALMPGTFATSGYREQADGEPWRISAIADKPLTEALDMIDEFNAHHEHEEHGQGVVDMIEIKVAQPGEIDEALDELPEDIFPFFEFPVTEDCRGFVAALAGEAAAAKIRTGGVVGNAFPTVSEVAAFIHACATADVAFKATAGLHHPVRGSQRLTYEKDSASCVMHGFLNVFLAAVIAKKHRPDEAVTRAILAGEDAAEFKVSDSVLGWREHLVEVTEIALLRESFALTFGSCSFDEPVADLKRLNLL